MTGKASVENYSITLYINNEYTIHHDHHTNYIRFQRYMCPANDQDHIQFQNLGTAEACVEECAFARKIPD